MTVTLKHSKAAVVDALRAARKADDEFSRLRENSWEKLREDLNSLVESPNWKHGPAELIATFPHHLVAKAPGGAVVQVEWSRDDDGSLSLGRAVIHEMATPVADLGVELMETAKTAVDHILVEDYDAASPMIASMAEALDSGGDLQRRISNEVTVRALKRNAWWHGVVGEREGIEDQIPQPTMEDEIAIAKSANDLLVFLKESAKSAVSSLRALSSSDCARDLESLADDIAEDMRRAVNALSNVDLENSEETLQIYEAVMAATPRLLNGIAFLGELTQEQTTTEEG